MVMQVLKYVSNYELHSMASYLVRYLETRGNREKVYQARRLLRFEELEGWVDAKTQTCPLRKRVENFREAREKKRAANCCLPDIQMVATYFCREKGFLFSFIPFHSTQPKRSITESTFINLQLYK